MSDIPADKQRHPYGCPDADWCRGNRACYWDCKDGSAEDDTPPKPKPAQPNTGTGGGAG